MTSVCRWLRTEARSCTHTLCTRRAGRLSLPEHTVTAYNYTVLRHGPIVTPVPLDAAVWRFWSALSPAVTNAERLPTCALVSVQCFASVRMELCFLAGLQGFLHILDINPLSGTRFANITLHSVTCLLSRLFPSMHTSFHFDKVQFTSFFLSLPVLVGSPPGDHCLAQCHGAAPQVFS